MEHLHRVWVVYESVGVVVLDLLRNSGSGVVCWIKWCFHHPETCCYFFEERKKHWKQWEYLTVLAAHDHPPVTCSGSGQALKKKLAHPCCFVKANMKFVEFVVWLKKTDKSRLCMMKANRKLSNLQVWSPVHKSWSTMWSPGLHITHVRVCYVFCNL